MRKCKLPIMTVSLKLTPEQIAAAIALLDDAERAALRRLLAEESKSPDSFAFWEHPDEDLYNDLVPDQPRPN
jgi:hypothetical protein